MVTSILDALVKAEDDWLTRECLTRINRGQKWYQLIGLLYKMCQQSHL
jgi:hypothetical protein